MSKVIGLQGHDSVVVRDIAIMLGEAVVATRQDIEAAQRVLKKSIETVRLVEFDKENLQVIEKEFTTMVAWSIATLAVTGIDLVDFGFSSDLIEIHDFLTSIECLDGAILASIFGDGGRPEADVCCRRNVPVTSKKDQLLRYAKAILRILYVAHPWLTADYEDLPVSPQEAASLDAEVFVSIASDSLDALGLFSSQPTSLNNLAEVAF